MRSGRYKLVLNLLHTDDLYDLRADPHRQTVRWMRITRDPFRGPEWEVRHWQGSGQVRWTNLGRHRPEDGYTRPVLEYETGRPPTRMRPEE